MSSPLCFLCFLVAKSEFVCIRGNRRQKLFFVVSAIFCGKKSPSAWSAWSAVKNNQFRLRFASVFAQKQLRRDKEFQIRVNWCPFVVERINEV